MSESATFVPTTPLSAVPSDTHTIVNGGEIFDSPPDNLLDVIAAHAFHHRETAREIAVRATFSPFHRDDSSGGGAVAVEEDVLAWFRDTGMYSYNSPCRNCITYSTVETDRLCQNCIMYHGQGVWHARRAARGQFFTQTAEGRAYIVMMCRLVNDYLQSGFAS